MMFNYFLPQLNHLCSPASYKKKTPTQFPILLSFLTEIEDQLSEFVTKLTEQKPLASLPTKKTLYMLSATW